MDVLRTDKIQAVIEKHPALRSALSRWMTYAEGAEWHNIMEVRQIFPTADGGVKGAYTVFNIKGNDFRLITVIDYELQVIAIIDIFTHAEYSKW